MLPISYPRASPLPLFPFRSVRANIPRHARCLSLGPQSLSIFRLPPRSNNDNNNSVVAGIAIVEDEAGV